MKLAPNRNISKMTFRIKVSRVNGAIKVKAVKPKVKSYGRKDMRRIS